MLMNKTIFLLILMFFSIVYSVNAEWYKFGLPNVAMPSNETYIVFNNDSCTGADGTVLTSHTSDSGNAKTWQDWYRYGTYEPKILNNKCTAQEVNDRTTFNLTYNTAVFGGTIDPVGLCFSINWTDIADTYLQVSGCADAGAPPSGGTCYNKYSDAFYLGVTNNRHEYALQAVRYGTTELTNGRIYRICRRVNVTDMSQQVAISEMSDYDGTGFSLINVSEWKNMSYGGSYSAKEWRRVQVIGPNDNFLIQTDNWISFNATAPYSPPTDTCSPPSDGSDWIVNMADNCKILSSTAVDGKLILSGASGNFTIAAPLIIKGLEYNLTSFDEKFILTINKTGVGSNRLIINIT